MKFAVRNFRGVGRFPSAGEKGVRGGSEGLPLIWAERDFLEVCGGKNSGKR